MLQAHRIEAKGQSRRHQAEKGEEEARIGHGGGQGKDHAEMAERQEPCRRDDEGPGRDRQGFIFRQGIAAKNGIEGVAEAAAQTGQDTGSLDMTHA